MTHIAFRITTLPLLLTLCLSGCGLRESTRPEATAAAATRVELFFATDRAPDSDDDNFYSGVRGEPGYGIATVSIPPGHVLGRREEPSLMRLQLSSDSGKHIQLSQVTPQARTEFTERLSKAVEASPDGRLMVFVHGYNEGFPDVTRRVAQFAHDLKFNGPVLLFSWPSADSLSGYAIDETNAEWAQADFVRLLGLLLDEIPASRIYLIGHSMGTRIIGRAVTALASDRLESDMLPFREIILIAPDIDTEVFRIDMVPRLKRTGIHVTLYASSNDNALRASKIFHGYPRAGESGDGLVVVDGVETIDASEVSGGLLGHSYFAEDRSIMEDIFSLLQGGQRAADRFGLEAVDDASGRYWKFRQ